MLSREGTPRRHPARSPPQLPFSGWLGEGLRLQPAGWDPPVPPHPPQTRCWAVITAGEPGHRDENDL